MGEESGSREEDNECTMVLNIESNCLARSARRTRSDISTPITTISSVWPNKIFQILPSFRSFLRGIWCTGWVPY